MEEQEHQPRGRKRMLPRPILSCLECRRKKLKCNRSLPNCDQCQKRRTTARCAYDAHELEPNDVGKGSQSSPNARKKAKVDSSPGPGIASGNSDTNSSGARLGIVEDLQARVGRLERLLTAKRHCPTKGQHDLECKTPGMLTIKGTGSRYHAMDQKIPMFFRFNEAVYFLHKLFNNPTMDSETREFTMWRKAIVKKRSPVAAPPSSTEEIMALMERVLPSHEVSDKLVAVYFDNHEVSTRVLHRPSFWAKCKQFWQGSEADKNMLPQLLAVVLIASRLGDGGFARVPSESSVSAESVFRLLRAWVSSLSSKQRMESSVLQTQCLVLIAQQLYPSEHDLLIADSAALVRSAITMGLHRDPGEFPKISIFQGELRRRLWMTIMELDLQNCLVAGMHPMIRNGEFTTSFPADACDEDLYENMARSPRHKEAPAGGTLYTMLTETLQLRLEALESVNNVCRAMESVEALKCVCVLKVRLDAFRDVQKHLPFFNGRSGQETLGHDFNAVLVIIHIHRSIISVCREHIFQHPTNETIHKLEEICVGSSLDILSLVRLFNPTDGTGKRNRYFDLFHILCHSDIVKATLLVCLALKAMGSSKTSSDIFGCSDDAAMSRDTLVMAVEEAMDSFLHRNTEPTSDLRDPLCLTVVLQSVRAKVSEEEIEGLMQEGASNVINICRQRLHKAFDSQGPYLASENNIAPLETAHYQTGNPSQAGNLYFPPDLTIDQDQLGIGSMQDFDFFYDWDWQQTLS